MKKIWYSILIPGILVLALCACGTQSRTLSDVGTDFETIKKTGSIEFDYAKEIQIERFEQYYVIHINEGGDYLVVPQGEKVPVNLPEKMVVLQQPLNKTYLVSTAIMDSVVKAECLDNIRLTGTKAKDWYIDEAVQALQKKEILFAGKYNEPDYELLLQENCNLALENTMIYHNPESKEKLEELGIPVLVERSSYESHPLGRMEWIKLVGVLYGKEQEAIEYFNKQVKKLEPVMEKEMTHKKVAFFYVTANGTINVRRPKDYIAKMIEMAGGNYALADLIDEEENALSTMNIQMEDFYNQAKDADVLIYNSTIVGELETIDDLVDKNPLFRDFKAVKEKNVYCTANNFFQQVMGTSDFIADLNHILTGKKTETLRYIYQLR